MLFLMLIFVVSDYVDARPGGGSSSRVRTGGGSKSSSGGSKSSSFSSGTKSSSGGSSYSSGTKSSSGGSSYSSGTKSSSGGTKSSSGGGGSYSGGGGSYSSSSSSGDNYSGGRTGGSFVGVTSDNVISAGVVMFFLCILIFVTVCIWIKNHFSQNKYSASAVPSYEEGDLQALQAEAQKKLAAFKKADPNFSETLLLDYIQNVFHQYYSALGSNKIDNLSPFFLKNALYSGNYEDFKYTEIVINALYIIGLDTRSVKNKPHDRIKVMLETNFTRAAFGSRRLRYLSEQEWHFVRLKDVQSLPPAKMQALACPSCGAPESFKNDTKCGACGTDIKPATMQWAVLSKTTVFEETYETNALVSYEEEMGTKNATIFAPNLKTMQTAFQKLHGIASTNTYFTNFSANVVQPAFMAIYAAWTAKNLAPIRHLISDFLYQTQDFWIQEYKAQGLTNHLDDIQISSVELAKIEIDKFYETFTVRIFASCKDYTTKDKSNAIVGGDKKKSRAFSEYWTFVRRIGTEQKTKDSLDLHACPSCAAPLDKMGMTGICGYCSHKVSSGDYSWVLSRITQDEAYN